MGAEGDVLAFKGVSLARRPCRLVVAAWSRGFQWATWRRKPPDARPFFQGCNYSDHYRKALQASTLVLPEPWAMKPSTCALIVRTCGTLAAVLNRRGELLLLKGGLHPPPCSMGVYENRGTLNMDPQIVGFP